MREPFTRRSALWLATAGAIGAAPNAPKQAVNTGGFFRFNDEITETPVVRLTGLESAGLLPLRENRSVSVKARLLVFSSDRAGAFSPFRLDLRTGQAVQVAQATRLDPLSLSLDAGSRLLLFLDGGTLKQAGIANKRVQTLAEDVTGFHMANAPADVLMIRRGILYTLTGERELARDVVWCQGRPNGDGCLFGRGSLESQELWYLSFRPGSKAVRLGSAPASQPCWSPSGNSVLYLQDGIIREIVPETGDEKALSGLSPVSSFSSNTDGSVLVAASKSKAQPTVNLVLRKPLREFTLCEHKASNPVQCQPVFSPDSRRVYFNTDFQGRPAIYSVNVEALISETSG